ncbi:hypothetical protein FPW79_08710 [Campylobacter jejuni]|uniref:Uncharacterized protein n=2 Tax=Campylobacter jejuni TaxID=197 RepID=A0A5T0HWT3_CAMJU|nr:hypothetical protein [Campylobacter jejuni]EAH5024887.1 hypothetical protein [Campylobacter jejuni]EAH5460347.1 hypothetical protein [Campylobacter jejuni]EAH5795369.1 hypothetical protein [Campylobacter jejuni]EAH6976213.1 hypothetical protein [Campylobacter jejuni]EAH7027921.1 hypothetical protein [Campylobacter jejuni]
MPYFITSIFAFFADIFKKFSVEVLFKGVVSAVYISFVLISFSLFIALLYYGITIVVFAFNQTNTFLGSLDSQTNIVSGTDNDIIGTVFSILRTLGLFKAFNDVLAIFSPTFISYFVFKLSVLVYVALCKLINSYTSLYHILK